MGLRLALIGVTVVFSLPGHADNWIEVGADPQGKYFVDSTSVAVDGETLRFRKKGVYNFSMLETFGDKRVSFRSSIGTIELDCVRRIHRVVQMDIISPEGEIVWSTGKMNRPWEDIAPNSLGEITRKLVCDSMSSS